MEQSVQNFRTFTVSNFSMDCNLHLSNEFYNKTLQKYKTASVQNIIYFHNL